MATASAYFSGTACMPSQRVGAAAAPDYAASAVLSPSKLRNPRLSECVPATIHHIARSFAAAADGGGDPVLSIDGV